MAIYRGDTALKAYKGDMQPVNIYKGNTKVAGWHAQEVVSDGIALKNLVTNGDFSNGTTGWDAYLGTKSATDGILNITCSGSQAQSFGQSWFSPTVSPAANHKIYVRISVRVTNSVCSSIRFFLAGTSGTTSFYPNKLTPTENAWYSISGVSMSQSVCVGDNLRLYIGQYYADAATAAGKVMQFDNALCIDLTATYGAGNEPSADYMDTYLSLRYVNSWFDGSSTAISLDGAYNVPPDSLVFDGKCVQGSTTGKNLCDTAHLTTSTADMTIVSATSSQIVISCSSGAWYAAAYLSPIPVTPNVAYRFSCVDASGSTSAGCRVDIYESDGVTRLTFYESATANTSFSLGFTPTSAAIIVRLRVNNNGGIQTATYKNLQLELGSTATAYEPYTGGIPSPNPSYPAPITNVGNLAITATGGGLTDTASAATIELLSVPDGTCDTYDAVTGAQVGRCAKVVFDGSVDEGWTLQGINAYGIANFKIVISGMKMQVVGAAVCDRFPESTSLAADASIEGFLVSANGNFFVRRLSSATPTVATLRTWLVANPVTVVYKLATPTTTQLTPDLPVIRTGIKQLSVAGDVATVIHATVKAMD